MENLNSSSTTLLFRVPRVATIKEFSNQINLTEKLLNRLIYATDKFYFTKKIPKKNKNQYREINAPSKQLKAVQRWILRNILEKIEVEDVATGFRKNTSIKDNAERHRLNNWIICMDIEDFFPSIPYSWIYSIFRAVGYNPHICHIFTRLCTINGHLPQGAATSPCLSNIVSIRLDRRIMGYTGAKNITYTRYADDLVFSSNNKATLYNLKDIVQVILEDENFEVNERKTRYLGPRNKNVITGLVITNDKHRKISIGRNRYNLIRSMIFNKYIKDDHNIPDSKINGYISFLKNVDPDTHAKLLAYIKKIQVRKSEIELTVDYGQVAVADQDEAVE